MFKVEHPNKEIEIQAEKTLNDNYDFKDYINSKIYDLVAFGETRIDIEDYKEWRRKK